VAAVAALTAKAKLAGLWMDRSERFWHLADIKRVATNVRFRG
jgi:hypothetical protein